MKSYVTNSFGSGNLVRTQYNPYTGVPYANVTVIPSAISDSVSLSLSVRASNVGLDRSTPRPFAFTKVQKVRPYGNMTVLRYDAYVAKNPLYLREEHSGARPDAFSFVRSPPVDNAYNKALEKLYAQMRGNLDLSVAVGELSATFKMIKATAKLSRYILGFHPKHWANHWLEYQYGWRPLVNDIFETVKEINHVVPQLQRFTARASESSSRTFEFSTGDTYRLGKSQQKDTKRVLISVLYANSASTAQSLARYASLNPASIAWELTPFSFVVDWMLDVGGYLRSLESSLVYSGGFSSGFVTTTTISDAQATVTGRGKVGYVTAVGTLQMSTITKTLDRVMLTSMPRPIIPRFNVELGSTRLVSAAALLYQFLGTEKNVPKKRKETQIAIDRQLKRFARGPRKWNDVMAAN